MLQGIDASLQASLHPAMRSAQASPAAPTAVASASATTAFLARRATQVSQSSSASLAGDTLQHVAAVQQQATATQASASVPHAAEQQLLELALAAAVEDSAAQTQQQQAAVQVPGSSSDAASQAQRPIHRHQTQYITMQASAGADAAVQVRSDMKHSKRGCPSVTPAGIAGIRLYMCELCLMMYHRSAALWQDMPAVSLQISDRRWTDICRHNVPSRIVLVSKQHPQELFLQAQKHKMLLDRQCNRSADFADTRSREAA